LGIGVRKKKNTAKEDRGEGEVHVGEPGCKGGSERGNGTRKRKFSKARAGLHWLGHELDCALLGCQKKHSPGMAGSSET